MSNDVCYKAVRLDKRSHWDAATKWRKGSIVRVNTPDNACIGACGVGIHSSRTLLDAVGWQTGPSIYCRVEPLDVLAEDDSKLRSTGVRVVDWIPKAELDELAGLKLWEANHPINPLLRKPRRLDIEPLIKEWDSVWASVRDSVWAYTGGLFPGITSWRYVKSLGPDPWRPLLRLWYAGYVPSFDGTTWRVHAGPKAEVVFTLENVKCAPKH